MAKRQKVTVDGRQLTLSNLDKVLYPSAGTTKADVLTYLSTIAPVLVPQAAGRPVTRKHWPDGVGAEAEPRSPFFRKDLEESAPGWVPREELEHSDHTNTYPLIDGPSVLAWLGQVAALEIHVPQWRFDADGAPQNPDRLVLDLDPGPGLGLAECAEVARLCRDILTDLGLESVPVTSGSKGIHLYAGLDGASTSEQVSEVAHELARSLEADHPDLVVSRMKKSLRRGRVLVDWSQNNSSKTTVCPYSLRGRACPFVAAPRTWDELDDPGLAQLDHRQVMDRVADGLDPMADLGRDPRADGTAGALDAYRARRDAARTPEPVPEAAPHGSARGGSRGTGEEEAGRTAGSSGTEPIFVIQEHHASRLHFDTRYERDGVLVSWAVPKGPPLEPGVNRLAVQTEDHPLEYARFEGRIPKGEYGAGEVTIWDSGTIAIEKWRAGEEIIAVLDGRPDGGLGGVPRRYVLVHTDGDSWLMQLMKDQPAAAAPFTDDLQAPMLATAGSPADLDADDEWAFEGKWDGYRAIAGVREDGVELRSRNGVDLLPTFPELAALAELVPAGTVVDGEIVALDSSSRPSFGLLQTRGKLTRPRDVERAMEDTPAHLFVFDLLRSPEHGSLLTRPYSERRALLEELLGGDGRSGSDRIQVPAALGVPVDAAIDISRELGLEGIVAKRTDDRYLPGRRSRGWIKIKHDAHQEAVVIGYRAGKGSRSSTLGSLLLAVPEDGELAYAGRVGSGFAEAELADLRAQLDRITRRTPAVGDVPAADSRDATWVSAKLVGEVAHSGRTSEGRLRQPIWRGLRPDKTPDEVRWESPVE